MGDHRGTPPEMERLFPDRWPLLSRVIHHLGGWRGQDRSGIPGETRVMVPPVLRQVAGRPGGEECVARMVVRSVRSIDLHPRRARIVSAARRRLANVAAD